MTETAPVPETSQVATHDPVTKTVRADLRRVVRASMAGTIVEWYEFFLYATAATLVFNVIFFPANDNPLVNVISAFATYAVGFVARPLGGVIFGHFGDRYGRKKLLQVAIIMVGASTFLMGCLPTFSQAGYWAPALLVLLRIIQGVAVGGEWGGAVLLVAEHAPDKERATHTSWVQASLPLGSLLATSVLLMLSWLLSRADFLTWGWRVGFWLSVIIVGIGYYIRTKVSDAKIFEETKETEAVAPAAKTGARARITALDTIRLYPGRVLLAMGIRFNENIVFYLAVTFSITYLSTQVHMDTSRILLLLFIAYIVHAAVIPLCGRLSDKIGRKPVFSIGLAVAGVWGFIAFPLFDTGNAWLAVAAITLGLIAQGFMIGPQAAMMAELFPTRIRYTGVSLGYQISSILAGSLAPIIATLLLSRFGTWIPIAFYVLLSALVTAVAVVLLPETRGSSLYALDEADRQLTSGTGLN